MKRLTIFAFLAMAGLVSAQNRDLTPTDLAVRLGGAYVIDDTTRDLTKSVMIGIGVDYFFPTQLIPGAETYLSVDWFGKSASGAKGNFFPLMLNARYYSKGEAGRRSYGFVGLGAVILDVTSTRTTIAGRLGVGVEVGPSIFTEASWLFSDKADRAKADSITFHVGYRF
jgi:hypothetical protein